jgi:hypothetical protein
MPTCPAGHDSTAPDFCDVCGIRIDGATPASAPSPTSGPDQAGAQLPSGPAEPCPQCGTERNGQFCEVCGFDFASRTPAAASAQAASPRSGWTAAVNADRAYFDRVVAAGGPDASTLEFPAYCPERRFVLSGQQMRIGRRSVSRGLNPEIDLTGPPADPGISHLHAVLVAQPGGGWAVLDPGSSNGTQVNGADIATGEAVQLRPGDRISIGAWTVLTIEDQSPGPPAPNA